MVVTDNTFEPHISKRLLEPPRSCPNEDCTSSDGFNIWEKVFTDGRTKVDGYCFVCGHNSKDPYGELDGGKKEEKFIVPKRFTRSVSNESQLSVSEGLLHPIRGISDRSISYTTAEYFGVRIGVSPTDGETPVYTIFPRHRDGDQVGWKTRTADKHFYSSGGNDVDLFGAHLCKPQGKRLYITEGEYDALSVYQALQEGSTLVGYHPAVLSLPAGAAAALKSFIINSELLEGYDELVLVFDNDEAGKSARDTICKAYAGKVSYVTIPSPFKDANDMLVAGKSNDLKWLCIKGAKKYHPDGIVRVKDLRESRKDKKELVYFPYPDSMPGLNEMFYGAKLGTLITILAGTGVGKTSFLHELFHHFITTTNEKVAGLFLEEDKYETIDSLVGLQVNKRITLPDVNITEEEYDEAFDKLFDGDRASLYDFFGGMDDGSLLSKLRYYAITGHTIIFLDHLSFVISETATEGDERKKIDVLMNKLSKFAKGFNIALFVVVHCKKSDGTAVSFEMGAIPDMDDAKGSSSIKQATWDMIALSRNQQHPNLFCRDITELTGLKCRLTGRTGNAGYLRYDTVTGRMTDIDPPADYKIKKGIRR